MSRFRTCLLDLECGSIVTMEGRACSSHMGTASICLDNSHKVETGHIYNCLCIFGAEALTCREVRPIFLGSSSRSIMVRLGVTRAEESRHMTILSADFCSCLFYWVQSERKACNLCYDGFCNQMSSRDVP
jgi:hypothetical protein